MSLFSDKVVASAVFGRRFAGLALADVDLQTYKTWDPVLARSHRILVPIDVQAYVVPAVGGEETVPIGAVRGDPEPFVPGVVRPAGVHLHWALPDRLLDGVADQEAKKLRMPPLPDRWVVIRTLLPDGARTAYATGWVIDAASGVVAPLATYAGSIDATGSLLTPLDAASRGTLLWSATYSGAERRFTLHDPLGDLPGLTGVAPQGFHRDIATYTVAGWWTRTDEDPLAAARSRRAVRDRASQLRWALPEDGEDEILDDIDPRVQRRYSAAGLKSVSGTTPVQRIEKYTTSTTSYEEAAPSVEVPIKGINKLIIGVAGTRYSTLLHGSVIGVPIGADLPAADERPSADEVTGTVGLDIDDVAAAFAGPGLGLSPSGGSLGSVCSRPSRRTCSADSPRATGWSTSRSTSTRMPSGPCPANPCPGPRPIACAPRTMCLMRPPMSVASRGPVSGTRMRGSREVCPWSP
ncbi:MAG: hypothetical protein IPM00_09205 [Tetrasphaera sp.]|nr:hypothetical protein [Tetrasphaera sp.]